MMPLALFALLLGEFDDQDAVLGCECDQHNQADLRVEVERQAREDDADERGEHADCHRQQDRESE